MGIQKILHQAGFPVSVGFLFRTVIKSAALLQRLQRAGVCLRILLPGGLQFIQIPLPRGM